ncbi:MAG: AraC family ligand binding domain-containing protein [Polyangiaceae bacterium]
MRAPSPSRRPEARSRPPSRRPANFFSRERARPTPAVHEIAALSFYTRGTATMEQRGCWTVGPGDVLLIPAGEPHRFLQADALEAWCLGLCVPCFAAEAGATFLDPFDRVRAGASPVFHIPEDRRTFVETLFRELHQASLPPRSSEPLAVQRSLLTLLLHEISFAPPPGPPPCPRAAESSPTASASSSATASVP